MTRPLRAARACQAATITLATCGLYSASIHPVLALPGLAAAVIFAVAAHSFQCDHQRILNQHERARRAAAQPQVSIPPACCDLWSESAGAYHSEHCTRPVDERRADYRLDPDTAAAFEEISSRYDDRNAA